MNVDRTTTLRPRLEAGHEQYAAFLQEQLFIERRRTKILSVGIVVVVLMSITVIGVCLLLGFTNELNN